MGKGDQKSRKGKQAMGSYGITRPRNPVKAVIPKPDAEAKPVAETTPVTA